MPPTAREREVAERCAAHARKIGYQPIDLMAMRDMPRRRQQFIAEAMASLSPSGFRTFVVWDQAIRLLREEEVG